MIRIAFFDVGETLVHDGQLFPGVAAALGAVLGLETAAGQPLFPGVISDYHMPTPPRTEAKVAALEQRYRDEVLGPNGLSGFFQPFESRVTISSRAGVFKPDRQIFELAVARSGLQGTLAECLFVTENTDHLEKGKALGMTPVRFGPPASGMAAFDDWADAPVVLAGLVAPGHAGNMTAGVAATLAIRHQVVGFHPTRRDGRTVHGRGGRLVQLNDPGLGALDGVYVELPTELTVELGADGRVAGASAPAPGADEVADALNFVSGLVKGGKVAIPGQATPGFGATHAAEKDAEGRLRLVRRGYSAR